MEFSHHNKHQDAFAATKNAATVFGLGLTPENPFTKGDTNES
jgi:hypothetical protein